MQLSRLEEDLIGDLAQDTHGLWEVFEFIRCHYPQASDAEVLDRGRDLLRCWIARDWIELSNDPVSASSIESMEEALRCIDRLGEKATRYWSGAPSIDLAAKAIEDLPWLRGDDL